MPHERKRYLGPGLARTLAHSQIAGILGQRQVGKTTLLEASCKEYATFDRAATLMQANTDAELFLKGHASPFGIDEAQLCAPLFPALKEHVRVDKRRGQFILSGSVRFTSKADIRESLTGRIVALELLPLTLAEIKGRPLPNICERILKANSAAALASLDKTSSTRVDFGRYLEEGGLPGICFFRDPHIRMARFEAHLDTLLNRDIRQVYPTTLPYSSLRALLEHLARTQGRPFEWAEAARASQISRITLKKVLFALEALFLTRTIPDIDGHKPTIFLEDQGTASWLKGSALENADDLTRGLYANLRQEYHYRPELRAKISHWRIQNEIEVPLIFSSRHGRLGIVPTLSEQPAPKTLGSAQSFLNKFPGSKVVIAYGGSTIVHKPPSMLWIPYWKLC